MHKGKRFAAICGDGIVRSAVVTASEAWAWDAISASVQVSKDGQRFSISGNLSAVGLNDGFLYRHAAPPGVVYRFHSATLTAVCGCTPHRPVAPRLRALAVRLGLTRFRIFNDIAACWLALDLRAAAARRGLVSSDPQGEQSAHRGAEANRAALARIKPEPLARMARLAWAFRCFKGAEGKGAWDTARRI